MLHTDNEKPRPSVQSPAMGKQQAGSKASNEGEASTLLTRRRFLYGAIGVGAVAAIGAGGFAYSSMVNDDDGSISSLDSPASSLTPLSELEALESYDGEISEIGEFDLPYGTLVWANDESVAACLLPTDSGSPLTQVGLLLLGSGSMETVLESAIGSADGFEIYDVRANGNGVIWTEANILQGMWRIYAAPLTDGAMLGQPVLLEEGGNSHDTPTLAVAGNRAFWQVLPKDASSGANSRLMGATFGKGDAETVYESRRRMGTPPYGSADSVTIAPRVDSPSLYYELVNIDADTGDTLDALTLPHTVAPSECGYGPTGFMFAFPDIYKLDGAIANLGTYTPKSRPTNNDYNSAEWFDFTRTPTAAPAWCNHLLIVKSSYSVCCINLEAGTYFAIDVENGADTYGEYLASTGTHDTFVTYTNIDHTPVGEAHVRACRVKVWSTLHD